MVVPYIKGLSDSSKNISDKMGIQVHFKGGNTIRILLVAPKDKETSHRKVEYSIGTSVTGWTEIRNIYVNIQGTSGEDQRIRAPSPILTVAISQANLCGQLFHCE